MKYQSLFNSMIIAAILSSISANAQVATGGSFTLEKSIVAGGGGSDITGGNFKVEGTIGQAAAGTRPNGSGKSMQNGFWVGETLAPTAADVSVSGRILSATGRGIRNVRVTMTDANGTTRTTSSSTFGYYKFQGITAGQTVILTVSAKRFEFSQPVQVVMLNDNLNGIDFIAN